MLTGIIIIVFLALVFDYINGFHDAANSIATIIATNVLKPWQALLWAALFNLLAFFVFPLKVATTIGSDIINPVYLRDYAIAAVLLGAISFNLITWFLKLPSSSSHALIGALVGIGLLKEGMHGLNWTTLGVIFASVIISPILGMVVSAILIKILPRYSFNRSHKKFFSGLQLLSSALLSLGHGGNDAQKTMGIIAVVLYSSGALQGTFHIPAWVVISCYTVMALGTLSGGWRIIRTVGYEITPLKAPSGACAEFGAAFTLFIANHFGIPISSTHALTGSVVGVSTYNRDHLNSANWRLLGRIALAWVVTFPLSALFSAGIYKAIMYVQSLWT